MAEVLAPKLGQLKSSHGAAVAVDKSLLTVSSVLYDAVCVPRGKKSAVALSGDADAIHFLNQAFKHCKAVAIHPDADAILQKTNIAALLAGNAEVPGLVTTDTKQKPFVKTFIAAIAAHRAWEREKLSKNPA